MMKLKVKRPKVVKLWLTPIIDMLITVMIFLLISFSPDATKIKMSRSYALPSSNQKMALVHEIRVEISSEFVKVNGANVEGLVPSQHKAEQWKLLRASLAGLQKPGKTRDIVIIADKNTSYQDIDLALAHMAKAGFSSVYLLTSVAEAPRK